MESSIGELVLSGVKLMFIGMGIVYLFLALLVWVIGITSKLVQRFSPESQTRLPQSGPVRSAQGMEQSDDELVAVISAAIQYHQNQ